MALANVWQSPQKPCSNGTARALPPPVEGERKARKELRMTMEHSNDQAMERVEKCDSVVVSEEEV
jgi:hypothetical protein